MKENNLSKLVGYCALALMGLVLLVVLVAPATRMSAQAPVTWSNSVAYSQTAYATNNLNLIIDFNRPNYVYIETNNNLTISGFQNIDWTKYQFQVLNVSNSAASGITFAWPAGVRTYGTNSGTSISIPAAKVLRATFSVDIQGTNISAVCSN